MKKPFTLYNSTKLDIEMDVANQEASNTLNSQSLRDRGIDGPGLSQAEDDVADGHALFEMSESFNEAPDRSADVQGVTLQSTNKVKRLLGPEYLTFKIRSIEDLKELKKLMSDDFYCGLELVNKVQASDAAMAV